jgi:hypothetical protein
MDVTPVQPTQPSQAEPVPVQLTRMEGTINLIAYQFSEVKDDIKELRSKSEGHSVQISALELANATKSGASAAWTTWLPILAAIAAVVVAIVAIYH